MLHTSPLLPGQSPLGNTLHFLESSMLRPHLERDILKESFKVELEHIQPAHLSVAPQEWTLERTVSEVSVDSVAQVIGQGSNVTLDAVSSLQTGTEMFYQGKVVVDVLGGIRRTGGSRQSAEEVRACNQTREQDAVSGDHRCTAYGLNTTWSCVDD